MSETPVEMPASEMPKFELPQLPKLPSMTPIDTEALVAAQRRNVEAMSSASQILADGARTFGQRQSEIFQSRMNDLAKQSEALLKTTPAEVDVSANVDLMKAAYAQVVSDARELVDIVAKAQADAMHVMTRCVITNLDEMKKLAG